MLVRAWPILGAQWKCSRRAPRTVIPAGLASRLTDSPLLDRAARGGLLELDEDGDIVFFLSPNFIRQSILRSRAVEEEAKVINRVCVIQAHPTVG